MFFRVTAPNLKDTRFELILSDIKSLSVSPETSSGQALYKGRRYYCVICHDRGKEYEGETRFFGRCTPLE